uniref:Uncharacterized protein n=1 Tax=Knipowitschia caucasica TaxID=637954 RepID=A0AAV2JMM2_KNICA
MTNVSDDYQINEYRSLEAEPWALSWTNQRHRSTTPMERAMAFAMPSAPCKDGEWRWRMPTQLFLDFLHLI